MATVYSSVIYFFNSPILFLEARKLLKAGKAVGVEIQQIQIRLAAASRVWLVGFEAFRSVWGWDQHAGKILNLSDDDNSSLSPLSLLQPCG